MIEKIIFITVHKFDLRDYRRFGIEILEQSGFKVEVWYISNILYPKLSRSNIAQEVYSFSGLKLFKDKTEAYLSLSNLPKSTFIINFLSYSFNNLWVYRAISKSDSDYAVLCVNVIPVPSVKRNGIGIFKEALKRYQVIDI